MGRGAWSDSGTKGRGPVEVTMMRSGKYEKSPAVRVDSKAPPRRKPMVVSSEEMETLRSSLSLINIPVDRLVWESVPMTPRFIPVQAKPKLGGNKTKGKKNCVKTESSGKQPVEGDEDGNTRSSG